MKIYAVDFNRKADLLKAELFRKKAPDEIEKEITPALCTERLYTVFFSVCDTFTRARVIRFSAPSLAEAWRGASTDAMKFVSSKNYNPAWVRADYICKSEAISVASLNKLISECNNGFYRRGISFDKEMKTALIEAEINGNRVISYKEPAVTLGQLNKYLPIACGQRLASIPEEIVVFDCKSAFCDENDNTFELYGKGSRCGRRTLKKFDRAAALEVIKTSSEYLSMQLDFSGKFEYGVYPIYHKPVTGYNILRHASSVWGLICAYRITGDKFTLRQIECSLGFLVRNCFYKYQKPRDEENTVFVADLEKREVKLGGNAVAIIAFSEYMSVTGSDRYKKLCTELGNGILELMNAETGEFIHVLDIPSLNIKDKTRTVYYDGEAAFALARLYGLTGNRKWLDAAEAAVERFIREDYTRYCDHWVAYAINEITKYLPEERYYKFALENAQVNLKKIYNQKTTYHTYLELLCVTAELYGRITGNNADVGSPYEFDEDYFVKTVFHRADYMLNGYCYPEYVMYLKYPGKILGAFFMRHDGYRIRIDDVQHFCGAYCALFRNYETLDRLRDNTQSRRERKKL